TGSCARSFYVGKELEPKDISAKFENGIQTLNLPKAEAKKLEPKQTLIEIAELQKNVQPCCTVGADSLFARLAASRGEKR
uniref:Hsp20 family protein n=1 Tax=Gemmiger formicilis TaxID=745368 RepID=UPI004026E226